METLIAPAKINLVLKITGRTEDGFHCLETVFQTIDLRDELTWKSGEKQGIQYDIDGDGLGPIHENLIFKAADLFFRTLGEDSTRTLAGTLSLVKRIPAGGGLGGGSSDAATTLSLLNQRLGYPLKQTELHRIAYELGADVPFFLEGGTRIATGRGEKLSQIELPPNLPRRGFLIFPPYGCNTAVVYKTYAAKRPNIWQEKARKDTGNTTMEWGRNDLQAAAIEAYPQMRAIYDRLRLKLPNELFFLSGSGSTWVVLTERASLPDLELGPDTRVINFRFLSQTDRG